MNKRDFRKLFLRALRAAAELADVKLTKRIPRSFLIELHAPTSSGNIMNVDEALDRIYISNDRFYRIIDIAVRGVASNQAIAFVRVSGHPPGQFNQTLDPDNLGPFKQVLAQRVDDQARAG